MQFTIAFMVGDQRETAEVEVELVLPPAEGAGLWRASVTLPRPESRGGPQLIQATEPTLEGALTNVGRWVRSERRGAVRAGVAPWAAIWNDPRLGSIARVLEQWSMQGMNPETAMRHILGIMKPVTDHG